MMKRNKLFGAACLLLVMIAASLIMYLIAESVVIDDENTKSGVATIGYSSADAKTFRESEEFTNFFINDCTNLTENLAVAGQMESGGHFDGEKKVDIIKYYYRRHPSDIPARYQDLHIEYKLADLLAWADYNVNFYELSKEDFLEKNPRYKSSEDETEENDTKEKEKQSADQPLTDAEGALVYEDEVTYDENGQPIEQMQDAYIMIQEEFLPADGISLYQRDYPEGKEVFHLQRIIGQDNFEVSLNQILEMDLEDLSRNYRSYENKSAYMKRQGNMKFVLFDPEGRMVKSNLILDKDFMTQDKEARNEAIENAFRKQNTYGVFTFGTARIEDENLKVPYRDYDRANLISRLRAYDYAFQKDSRLMVCILDPGTKDEILGSSVTNDIYGKADLQYSKIAGKTMDYLVWTMVLLAAAFLCLIVFTVTVPKLEKEQITGFHAIPTGFAAGILIVFGILMAAIPIGMRDQIDEILRMGRDGISLLCTTCWICLFLAMLAFLYGWYSLILRIKGKTFFSNSVFVRIFCGTTSLGHRFLRYLLRVAEKFLGFFRTRKNIMYRTVLPYTGFVFVNMIFLVAGRHAFLSLLVCFLFDVAVGILMYQEARSAKMVEEGVSRIVEGDISYQINTEKMFDGNKKMALEINKIGNTVDAAVQKSLQDERMKTELITNVSHDIKTPLTSIINYVDLLKREDIQDEKAQEYIRILDEKSQRLKVLILDLVEASKISSGNITLENTKLDMCEMISQALGEFEDRLEERNLTVICDKPENSLYVWADSVRLWRVLENLLGNICKYSMPASRVYIDLSGPEEKTEGTGGAEQGMIRLTMKNISEKELNITPQELTERFVRGDESRNTEGSGLGLSIAKDLVDLMKGTFTIDLDGDLFKITILLPESK